ncbi:MAG: histidine kinase [Oscillospiraceae bacterium]|nr:histidine kinase [Oscillospiraceae bacterium]
MTKQRTKDMLFAVLMGCICAGFLAVLLLSGLRDPRDWPKRDAAYTELTDFRPEVRKTEAYAGAEKRYTTVLPEVETEKENLFVYFVHAYAQVSLDGEVLAVTNEDQGQRLGHSPGCYWLVVPLAAADSGKELEIVSIPIYTAVENRNPRVFLGRWNSVLIALAHECLWELILSIICMVSGLLVLTFSLLLHSSRQERMQMLYLGVFTLSVGLWRLSDLQITPMVLPRFTVLLYVLAFLSTLLCPVFFCRFLYWRHMGNREGVYGWLSILLAAESLALIVLQLLGLVELRAVLSVPLLAILMVGAVIAVHSVRNLSRGSYNRMFILDNCMYLAFVLAVLFDLLRFLTVGNSRFLTGFLTVTVLHLLAMGMSILRQAAERQRRAGELEAELAKEHTRLMLSQIQPHFLYNALSVIRELCHRDPEKAEKATVRFADYLRQNMDSLLMEAPVPFREELRHTQNYAELEQLRFQERLQMEYDIPIQEFSLPALTLQPIVENAVKYTMRAQVDGRIVIRTRETETAFLIRVEDNGPGFDPEAVPEDGKSHVGIRNVRNRLSQMCGGQLYIESVIGEGTTAVIEIPKTPETTNRAGEEQKKERV